MPAGPAPTIASSTLMRAPPLTGVSRTLRQPAASMAAAADAPAGTRTIRPSTATAIIAAAAGSRRSRNIKAPRRKGLEHRVEHAFCDHRRKPSGMRRGERDAAVTTGEEGAGTALGVVIDRQPVGRHDP